MQQEFAHSVFEAVEKQATRVPFSEPSSAAGVDAVIIWRSQTDFYNPNVIPQRELCLCKQIASATSEETIAWLKKE